MESMSYNFAMEDQKPVFTTATETKTSTTTDSFTPSESRVNNTETVFSPLAAQAQYHGRGANELLAMMAQQEPRQADPAPTQAEMDMINFRMNNMSTGSELLFEDMEHSSAAHNFYLGNSRSESVSSNMWSEGSVPARGHEVNDTFDFLVKSLSSANNYVSMLTREQLSVLRSIRPSLLYEFLQEVAKVRVDKRMRRAAPNECAFCKNNGENEDAYTSHALKDWRGRVLCPVLRAFRCPRCGATGDRAHTIKYCPDADAASSDRSGLASRRRASSSLLLASGLAGAGLAGGALRSHSHAPPTPPAPSPSPMQNTSLWGNYGIN